MSDMEVVSKMTNKKLMWRALSVIAGGFGVVLFAPLLPEPWDILMYLGGLAVASGILVMLGAVD
jgi:hypothetical protein